MKEPKNLAEKELREQESMFSCFRGSLHKSERSESKAVSRVTEMLEKQQDIIRNLSARIEAMETDAAADPPSPAENPAPKKTEDPATSCIVLQISEQPLVEPRWSSCRVQSSHEELRAEIQRLEIQVAAMERDMSSYPYRTIALISRKISPEMQCRFCELEATHFSDACPTVVTSLQRSLVLIQKGLSFWCLDSCGGQNCGSKDKLCFYCKHLLGTVFQDEIPDDEGHHRAICPVPEKKGLMKERIQRLKERLRELKKEEKNIPARGVS
ncbi:unnamed protein product [Heligmosomoides polygyrus]|uniref:CCHC-type domain-containing protein n=1 Tax=Heligmosomoides polygyrus TaxID=6339 RepID=A0A183FHK5_HELPZ|nr:unnamed protein product [Heligmosomoides polygyrus]